MNSTNRLTKTDSPARDLICFSHLRWDFVFQRPQHLMSRFARNGRVFFVEDPIFEGDDVQVRMRVCSKTGVNIAVPVLPESFDRNAVSKRLQEMVSEIVEQNEIQDYIAWYYTPMAIGFASHLRPSVTVYDCMDELSLFRGAPPLLVEHEKALLNAADLVFTGGLSLFEAKCELHRRVHAFPSSVDVPHFAQARGLADTAADQQFMPHPRIGYAGVIDERMDLELIAKVAEMRPDWQLIMLGPVVKIPVDSLPKASNIHYLGMKNYSDLPAYFAGWDVAMLPFAMNESTRFISPTKTPEYLAAGLPVVSTPIRDVVRPYGEIGLARIASTADEFCSAVEHLMNHSMSLKWRQRADSFLATLSWDSTWREMNDLIRCAAEDRNLAAVPKPVSAPSRNRIREAMNV